MIGDGRVAFATTSNLPNNSFFAAFLNYRNCISGFVLRKFGVKRKARLHHNKPLFIDDVI
jgi:hypothetical protein